MTSSSLINAMLPGGANVSFGPLLLLGALAIYAAMFYATVRDLRAAYAEQGRRFSRSRLTGREAVCRLLQHLGLPSDRIDDGAKIDHYNLWRRRIRLRTESSVSSSVAALAIAAHEVGHAEQFATGYWAARATRWLLVLLILSAAILFVFPFLAPLAGAGEPNLTRLMALLVVFPVLRLPVNIALESDATKRAKRLLVETSLADETEQAGIARFLAAAFRTHLAVGVGLVLLVGACVAVVSQVEGGLDMPLPTNMHVDVLRGFDPSGQAPIVSIDLDGGFVDYAYTLVMVAFSLVLAWWALRGQRRKAPRRSAVDANNEGMARFQAGDPAGAIVNIEEALRRDPGLASAHYNRAVVLCSQGHSDMALESIEAMFACRPEAIEPFLCLADVWHLRGTLRLDRGDYEGAVDDLSRALSLDPPGPATLLRNRGLAWLRLGQLDRALQDTDAALALEPDDAIAYNNRGVIYREQGNLDQAEIDLRQALEIDPVFPNPRQHLAKLLDLKQEAAVLEPSASSMA